MIGVLIDDPCSRFGPEIRQSRMDHCLKAQVADPQHVFLLLRDGTYVSHGTTHFNNADCAFMRGQPIRFTLLAAQMMQSRGVFESAKLVPA